MNHGGFSPLGLGMGWRPELAHWIDRRPDLGFVEVTAENLNPHGPLPAPLERLMARGTPVVLHGISLSLGGAEPPREADLARLAKLARRLKSPLVSEHLAFVRAGDKEAGHLLPLPRTAEMLDIVVENVHRAKAALSVPLAVENIATLFEWPGGAMDEAAFLTEVMERTDVAFLLDVSNVYANAHNHGGDAKAMLDRLPLERIAYVHVGGGVLRNGVYHDTHAHPVPSGVLDLLEALAARTSLPGVLLERDEDFPAMADLTGEVDAIAQTWARGVRRREGAYVG